MFVRNAYRPDVFFPFLRSLPLGNGMDRCFGQGWLDGKATPVIRSAGVGRRPKKVREMRIAFNVHDGMWARGITALVSTQGIRINFAVEPEAVARVIVARLRECGFSAATKGKRVLKTRNFVEFGSKEECDALFEKVPFTRKANHWKRLEAGTVLERYGSRCLLLRSKRDGKDLEKFCKKISIPL